MKKNQFITSLQSQGDRLTVQIPVSEKKKFTKLHGKKIKVTLEEL